MIRVCFFASIRERLGIAAVELPFDVALRDVASLVRALDSGVIAGAANVLLADNTLVALNRSIAGPGSLVSDGDEVAFYPPVTGG